MNWYSLSELQSCILNTAFLLIQNVFVDVSESNVYFFWSNFYDWLILLFSQATGFLQMLDHLCICVIMNSRKPIAWRVTMFVSTVYGVWQAIEHRESGNATPAEALFWRTHNPLSYLVLPRLFSYYKFLNFVPVKCLSYFFLNKIYLLLWPAVNSFAYGQYTKVELGMNFSSFQAVPCFQPNFSCQSSIPLHVS